VALATVVAEEIGRPFDLEQGLVTIGTAIGIAFGGPQVSTAELLRRADVAMYQAKHGGGELPYELYRPEFDGEADRRDVLIRAIPAAIASGDVRLVFQPVVDVSFGARPVGAEALVRWRHPTVGDVSSREIVDTARAAGLLAVFSEHVLRMASRAAAQWNAVSSGPACFVAVNASVEELADSAFVETVERVLAETGLTPALLHIEVGEKVIVDPAPVVGASLRALDALGARIVLDDVGQVNLSLSSLHAESLSAVKIDRRLVTNAMRSETDRLVLRSVVELSHRLGHLVIVGGVESEHQVDMIRSVGGTTMQGYHLGVPESAEAISRLFAGGLTAPGPVVSAVASAPTLPSVPSAPSLLSVPPLPSLPAVPSEGGR
jgi:predicted signal transduction protein with EAL and GGDEF domain